MKDKIPLTPEQCRAGRALLGWTRETLAERAKVSVATLADFEPGSGKRTLYERTLSDIAAALEKGGVEFIAENGGGAGVRLVKRKGKK